MSIGCINPDTKSFLECRNCYMRMGSQKCIYKDIHEKLEDIEKLDKEIKQEIRRLR